MKGYKTGHGPHLSNHEVLKPTRPNHFTYIQNPKHRTNRSLSAQTADTAFSSISPQYGHMKTVSQNGTFVNVSTIPVTDSPSNALRAQVTAEMIKTLRLA